MRELSFAGGIHPPEHKELTERSPIKVLAAPPKTVSIPITMGGAPNRPVVAVGDEVAKGQVIADNPTAFMGVPVHASIAGTVKAIGPRQCVAAPEQICITIEGDGSARETLLPPLDPFTCTHDEAVKRVRDAGIVGMGGGAFPTHVKLSPTKPIDVVIANGAECEPYLTVDWLVMDHESAKLVDGLLIAMHIVGAPRGINAIEANKRELVHVIETAIGENEAAHGKVTVAVCKTKYPQGAERNIIKACTGKEVPSGGLPQDVGCVIQNVGTLCVIARAFRFGTPLVNRYVTMSGHGLGSPGNIAIPVGSIVKDIEADNFKPDYDRVVKIISGGPMMGAAMPNTDFPITKNTSGVLYLTAAETRVTEDTPCLGCGRCAEACSNHLTPVMIVRSLKANKVDAAVRFGLMDCVECGACAYVCPVHYPLAQFFQVGKTMVRQKRAAAAKAEAAKAAATTAATKGGN
jgi:electron transport complex protein RnfC